MHRGFSRTDTPSHAARAPSAVLRIVRRAHSDHPATVGLRRGPAEPEVAFRQSSRFGGFGMEHATSGPTSRTYFSQRLRLYYVDWGNPEAPPLLLLHGGRDHCRNWDWVAAELRQDWHVIAPDLRGHGDSQWS